jgi:AraC-like DNA-binding protein
MGRQASTWCGQGKGLGAFTPLMARVWNGHIGNLPMAPSEELASMAQHVGYRVKAMACALGCSRRWLQVRCQQEFALTPHAWLAGFRTKEIQKQVKTGTPAKVLCRLAGFADTASFCHSLKRATGCTLRELRRLGLEACAQKDNKNRSPPIAAVRETTIWKKSGRCLHETLTEFSQRPARRPNDKFGS